MFFNTISPGLKQIIEKVFEKECFADFRLFGGTALSLQIGHRISIDADFIAEKIEDVPSLYRNILEVFPEATDLFTANHGVFFKVNGIKVDFLCWNIPFIRNAKRNGLYRLTDLEEISAMKIFAILQRGEKKDYMDIASLLQIFTLPKIISIRKGISKVMMRLCSGFFQVTLILKTSPNL